MKPGLLRLVAVLNVLLAVGLVGSALWLYGREHATRQVERQIRELKHATRLEEETIQRLAVEWQRLRNPMRLQALAQLKLNLVPPDPTAVLPLGQALALLPLRPAPTEEENVQQPSRGALAEMAAQAARDDAPAGPQEVMSEAVQEVTPEMARDVLPGNKAADAAQGMTRNKAAGADALGNLIRNIMPKGGSAP